MRSDLDYWVFWKLSFRMQHNAWSFSGTCYASVTEFASISLSWCRGRFPCSRLSDQRDSPVAGRSDRRPCCAGPAASGVWSSRVENCGDFPQVQFLVRVCLPVLGAVCQTAQSTSTTPHHTHIFSLSSSSSLLPPPPPSSWWRLGATTFLCSCCSRFSSTRSRS